LFANLVPQIKTLTLRPANGSQDEYATAMQKTAADKTLQASHMTVAQFDKKRLCERWLDALFMVLYEVRLA
jgi:hypothetical protein